MATENTEARANPHMLARRAEKVTRLVNVIDRVAIDTGIDPIRGALIVAQVVIDHLDESGWSELARAAKCNPPSADTIKAVRHVYVQRDEQATDDHFDALRADVEELS